MKRDSDNSGVTTVEISGSEEVQNKAKDLINNLLSDSGCKLSNHGEIHCVYTQYPSHQLFEITKRKI